MVTICGDTICGERVMKREMGNIMRFVVVDVLIFKVVLIFFFFFFFTVQVTDVFFFIQIVV